MELKQNSGVCVCVCECVSALDTPPHSFLWYVYTVALSTPYARPDSSIHMAAIYSIYIHIHIFKLRGQKYVLCGRFGSCCVVCAVMQFLLPGTCAYVIIILSHIQ